MRLPFLFVIPKGNLRFNLYTVSQSALETSRRAAKGPGNIAGAIRCLIQYGRIPRRCAPKSFDLECLMFEDSLVESQIHVVSPSARWTAAASITLQAAVASLLVILPLLRTDLLPPRASEMKLFMPLPVPPPPPPRTVLQQASSAISTAIPVLGRMLSAPLIPPNHIDNSPQPSTGTETLRMGDSTIPGVLATGDTGRPSVIVTSTPQKKPGRLAISSGVSAGLLLAPIQPVYPPIAKAAHVEGTVVVEAVISKTGTIESLHVVSGPAMLQNAALDAIRAARYRPFRLNNEPTEVQTTITVNFRMGG